MKCPFYLRKVGGYNYGWKCSAYHNGLFVLYSNGEKIQYFTGSGHGGAEYNKNGRDKYVKEKCLSSCNDCGLYQAQMKNKETEGKGDGSN